MAAIICFALQSDFANPPNKLNLLHPHKDGPCNMLWSAECVKVSVLVLNLFLTLPCGFLLFVLDSLKTAYK